MKRKPDGKKITKVFMKELIKGVLAFLCGMANWMGYYPFVPAYFAVHNLKKIASFGVIAGTLAGMYLFMEFHTMVRYVFVLAVIMIGIRLYVWANGMCNCVIGGFIAGLTAIAMNYAKSAGWGGNEQIFLLHVLEGVVILFLTMTMHFLFGIPVFASIPIGRKSNS
mgnify:CR=1 FL=1